MATPSWNPKMATPSWKTKKWQLLVGNQRRIIVLSSGLCQLFRQLGNPILSSSSFISSSSSSSSKRNRHHHSFDISSSSSATLPFLLLGNSFLFLLFLPFPEIIINARCLLLLFSSKKEGHPGLGN